MSNVISGTLNIGSGTPYDIILSESSGLATVFNNRALDIDFAVSGTGVGKFLYYDASTGRLGINVNDPDSALHVVAPCSSDGLKIESITNCATGVRVLLLHNPGTAASTGSFPATIDLAGKNTNDQTIYYGQIKSRILNPATSQTSGEILFYVDHTGTSSEIFKANTNSVVLGGLNVITGYSYNIIGGSNNLSGLVYVNVGSKNSGTVTSGLLLGNNISLNSTEVICVSNLAIVSGNNIVLFGNDIVSTGNDSILIANDARLNSSNSIILGNSITTNSGSHYNLLIANNASVSGASGIGFGSIASITGDGNLFIGNTVRVIGSNNSSIGSNTSVTGNNNIIYGSATKASGSNIVSVGNTNIISNVNSGLFIGNSMSLVNSDKTIIMGLNNQVINELDSSVLIGIDNNTSAGSATGLVMVGQTNIASDIVNSLVLGSKNNLSGTVKNNVVLGPDNYAALTSNNNIIVGGLNNNSGLGINSQGEVSGTSSGVFGTLNNTIIVGVNNFGYTITNGSIFGNKNYVSGNNLNVLGSFNNIKNASYVQNIGNSNFVNGNYNNIFGGRSTVVGTASIVNNPSKRDVYSFGSGNILFGDNEIVVSGICVGDNNDLYGTKNLVYGSNNIIGSTRHIGTVDGTTLTINGDVRAYYQAGQRILVVVYNPIAASYVYNRLIVTPDGGVAVDYITTGFGAYTTINLGEGITTDGLRYGIKNNFDDPLAELSSTVTVIVFPYEITETDSDSVTRTKNYGTNNIVVGSNNRYYHHGGMILGNRNNITGINNVIIGYNISGTFNNTLQIGTSNSNKIYLDNSRIIFNTGLQQDQVIFKSRSGGTTTVIDMNNNRVGVNNSSPSSSVDVSGTITTSGLRVGLSTVSGYSLIADANGNASWQFPVNLSGTNAGILFKVNDKIGSGSDVFSLTNASKHVNYIYTLPAIGGGTNSFEGFTLTPSGLYINETSDDETVYNVRINGSGIGDLADLNIYQDDGSRIVLFKTLPQYNAVQVFNITGVSGHLYRHTVTQQINLPTSLTGTFLSVRAGDGLLSSTTTPPNVILFGNRLAAQSGSNDLKFFSAASVMTIGATGGLSASQAAEFQGIGIDRSSDIILSCSSNHGTVFNNAGRSDKLFSIYNSGSSSNGLGFHYYPKSGSLAVGVETTQTFQKTIDGVLTDWKEHNIKLFVNGTARVHGLQFVENNGFSSSITNTYLRVNPNNGQVYRGALDLSTVYSGIWPVYINTDISSRVDIGLSQSATPGGTAMGAAGNGAMLVYNGGGWVTNAKGLYLYQPSFGNDNPNAVPGAIIGPNSAGRLNTARNSLTFAGTPFNGTAYTSYRGSNQSTIHMLKGRTTNASSTELRTDFVKESAGTVTKQNTISIDTLFDPLEAGNELSRSGILGVWNYTITYCGLISPVVSNTELGPSSDGWNAVAGKLEGAVLFYRNDSNAYQAIKLGSESQSFRTSSSYSSSWTSGLTPPLSVSFVTGVAPQRMQINALGVGDANILWNCTVDIHQLNHPDSTAVSGSL
jgi:hypothetical protein